MKYVPEGLYLPLIDLVFSWFVDFIPLKLNFIIITLKMISTDNKGIDIENLGELNKEHSPSIPLNFPKERLPGKFYYKLYTNL